jgi:hypothetical protein
MWMLPSLTKKNPRHDRPIEELLSRRSSTLTSKGAGLVREKSKYWLLMNGLSKYYNDFSPDEARRFNDELPCTDRSLKGPVKEPYRQQSLVAQGNAVIGFRGWSFLAADPGLAGWVTYIDLRQRITVVLSLKPGEHLQYIVEYIATVRLGCAWLGSGYGNQNTTA